MKIAITLPKQKQDKLMHRDRDAPPPMLPANGTLCNCIGIGGIVVRNPGKMLALGVGDGGGQFASHGAMALDGVG